MALLLQPPVFWGYRCAPSCPAPVCLNERREPEWTLLSVVMESSVEVAAGLAKVELTEWREAPGGMGSGSERRQLAVHLGGVLCCVPLRVSLPQHHVIIGYHRMGLACVVDVSSMPSSYLLYSSSSTMIARID